MLGELIIRWTIRCSMFAYAASLANSILGKSKGLARWMWILGWLFFMAHFLAAFHFYHHWNHQHAIDDTANQTRELLGWEFGEGIYFSYLFLLIWTIDALWWWRNPQSYLSRNSILSWFIHGYLFFIAFNGTVVFEAGPIRWFSLGACLLLGTFLVRSRTSN